MGWRMQFERVPRLPAHHLFGDDGGTPAIPDATLPVVLIEI